MERRIASHAPTPQPLHVQPIGPLEANSSGNSTSNVLSISSAEFLSNPEKTRNASVAKPRTKPSQVYSSPIKAIRGSLQANAVQKTSQQAEAVISDDIVEINIPTSRQSATSRQSPHTTTAAAGSHLPTPQPDTGSSTLALQTAVGSRTQPQEPAAKRRKVNSSMKPAAHALTRSSQPSQETVVEVTGNRENIVQGASVDEASSGKVSRRIKVPKTTSGRTQSSGDGATITAATQNNGDKRNTRAAKDGVTARRKRAKTPENAETIEIIPTLVKMKDLCQDSRTGKKSMRETLLQEKEEAEILRKQQVVGEDVPETPLDPPERRPAGVEKEPSGGSQSLVPSVLIVNGQIVHDEDSRIINRHDLADATRTDEREIIEDALTRRVNANSNRNLEKRQTWGEDLTDRFYDGLRMFGTDFEMISKMFPQHSRHQVKLKFVREERLDKSHVDEALSERIPVDMEEFSKLCNMEFMEVSELEREMAEDRKQLEEDQAKEKEAVEQALRQRVEDAAAESAAVVADSSAKENEAPTKKKRGRKNKGEKERGAQ